jgi:hypothetical protein
MPTSGVRGAGLVWAIKTIKLGVNSLNGYYIEFPISFVLKSKRNGRSINGKIEEGEVTGRLLYVELTYMNPRKKTTGWLLDGLENFGP